MTPAEATILVVEDHPTMRDALRLVLEHEGYDIRDAPDGEAALSIVRAEAPDLLLLDLSIPGLSGLEVLEALKADPTTAGVRVVVVTATGQEGRRRALALGAADYVTKPFSPLALLETVERVLAGSGPPAA